jgi:hypothetical protein
MHGQLLLIILCLLFLSGSLGQNSRSASEIAREGDAGRRKFLKHRVKCLENDLKISIVFEENSYLNEAAIISTALS